MSYNTYPIVKFNEISIALLGINPNRKHIPDMDITKE